MLKFLLILVCINLSLQYQAIHSKENLAELNISETSLTLNFEFVFLFFEIIYLEMKILLIFTLS